MKSALTRTWPCWLPDFKCPLHQRVLLESTSQELTSGFRRQNILEITWKQPTDTGNVGSTLGWEDLLEKEMATHSSILAWEVPRTEEPGGLQSTGWQRVRHDWVISLSFSIVVQELADNLFIVTVLVIYLFKYRGWSGVLIWKVIEWNAGGSVFTTYVIGWTKKHKHGIV